MYVYMNNVVYIYIYICEAEKYSIVMYSLEFNSYIKLPLVVKMKRCTSSDRTDQWGPSLVDRAAPLSSKFQPGLIN